MTLKSSHFDIDPSIKLENVEILTLSGRGTTKENLSKLGQRLRSLETLEIKQADSTNEELNLLELLPAETHLE